MTTNPHYDAIVLGAGPAGEAAVTRLHEQGLRIALVERELVGGECAYWACMPSKTLLRAPEVRCEAARTPGTSAPAISWDDVAEYRDFMIRNLDDAEQVKDYDRQGVRVLKGEARFEDERTVRVGEQTLTGDRILIATGSGSQIPSIPGLREAGFWTNREATTVREVPDSVVVMGGGPVGIELSQLFARLGAKVVLVEAASRLLAREHPRVSELIAQALEGAGVDVRCDAEVSRVSASNGSRVIHVGDERIDASQLVVAIGRAPRVQDLGLERAGIRAAEDGIDVDDRCRAGDGIWAIGDVTGVMPFTHVAKYQARIAAADIAGESVSADYTAVPRVVFCDPEVAAVGLSAEDARARGIDAVSERVELQASIARPWTYEADPRGERELVADREQGVLVGAWAVSPLASEWIHFASLAIKAGVPLSVLRDTVPQFPTYCEAYQKVVERLDA
jgi:dihydrolipoamide dehydrogenase